MGPVRAPFCFRITHPLCIEPANNSGNKWVIGLLAHRYFGVSMKNFRIWIRRIGVAGFLFFLVKGLVWLAVFLGLGSLFVK